MKNRQNHGFESHQFFLNHVASCEASNKIKILRNEEPSQLTNVDYKGNRSNFYYFVFYGKTPKLQIPEFRKG